MYIYIYICIYMYICAADSAAKKSTVRRNSVDVRIPDGSHGTHSRPLRRNGFYLRALDALLAQRRMCCYHANHLGCD